MRFAQCIAVTSALWVSVSSLGCQTYDFEPVTPLAIAQKTDPRRVVATGLKPNLMLLVDKSGSMNLPIDTGSPGCNTTCGVGNGTNFCSASCVTRWTDLQDAMATFLGAASPVARMGLTMFPTNSLCGPSNRIRIDISQSNDVVSELRDTALSINTVLQNIEGRDGAAEFPVGGTPIASSLEWVGNTANVPRLHDEQRDDFVLLLTDGSPNCNDAHPATNLASCRCQLNPKTTACGTDSSLLKIGCLDDVRSTAAVQALRQQDIRTIVVGFGAETGTTGEAATALNDMASAGGFARTCPNGTNAECGTGNTCLPSRECQTKYYAAKNAAELSTALTEIASGLTKEPCDFVLDTAPSDNEFISVFLNEERIPSAPDTWNYDPDKRAIHFPESGTVCPKLKAATPINPANLEFRIVQTL